MKITKNDLRKLIRESIQTHSQSITEAEGKKVFFVGIREAYEADFIVGIFDNFAAAEKALKQLQSGADEWENYDLWSYTITNSINEKGVEPDMALPD